MTTDPVATAFNIKDLFSSSLNPLQVILTLLVALGIGVFVYFIYKKTFFINIYPLDFIFEFLTPPNIRVFTFQSYYLNIIAY